MAKWMKENSILYNRKSLLHKDNERMLSDAKATEMNVESKYLTSYYTEIAEVNLFAFLYRLFHEWKAIFMKQSVDKCK